PHHGRPLASRPANPVQDSAIVTDADDVDREDATDPRGNMLGHRVGRFLDGRKAAGRIDRRAGAESAAYGPSDDRVAAGVPRTRGEAAAVTTRTVSTGA